MKINFFLCKDFFMINLSFKNRLFPYLTSFFLDRFCPDKNVSWNSVYEFANIAHLTCICFVSPVIF